MWKFYSNLKLHVHTSVKFVSVVIYLIFSDWISIPQNVHISVKRMIHIYNHILTAPKKEYNCPLLYSIHKEKIYKSKKPTKKSAWRPKFVLTLSRSQTVRHLQVLWCFSYNTVRRNDLQAWLCICHSARKLCISLCPPSMYK